MKNDRLLSWVSSSMRAALTLSPAYSGAGSWQPLGSRHLLAQGAGSSGQGEKPTVRVQRRRRSEPAGAEGRERAEAPRRRQPADQSPPPPRGTGGSGGGSRPPSRPSSPLGGQLPLGGRSPLFVGIVVLVFVCILAIMLLSGPGDSGNVTYTQPTLPPAPTESFAPVLPTASPKPFVPPAASSEGQTWLVMLYQDADDKILEQDIYVDLNEAERVGSTDRVQIVAQVDRFSAGYQGDGNWTSAKRFYITQDDDLQRVRSQQVADLGEVNMSDGATLADFVTWAVETFPADKHVLILSDHGMGWPGGWSDPAPGGRGDPSIPLSAALGDELYLNELDQALGGIRNQTGLDQFELIGMDACLMGHLEVLTALAPHARYAVVSQETEPALGWAYSGFLKALAANPDMDGAALGRQIVDSYIQDDQRIVDDQARADFLRQGSPMGGLFGTFGGPTADQLAQQMEQNVTLAAIDLAALPELMSSVDDLAYALQQEKQPIVARARSYAQSFTSVFGKEVPPSYIDRGSFVQLLKRESDSRQVAQAADGVLAALSRAVLADKHGPKKPGATGVSIYFPNSQLYSSPMAGPESYTAIARRFADTSLWDDFLAYHYTGRPFEPAAGEIAVPQPGTAVRGPGSGQIELSPITLSDRVAAPGRPVLLSTDVRGQNIGYVLFFTGYYDQASNSIFVADTDYLESADTREIDGVYYPVWPEGGEFTVEFEWEPLMFAIDDGVDRVVAMLTPQSYGATPADATYTVDGTYTYADGGESCYARLYFRDGLLRQVFGFTGQNGTGAPREIIPQAGDQFTVQETWMDLDQSGRVAQVATQEGGTLTFGDQMFAWKELDAAAGEYVVGFVVQDLDGNAYQAYERVTVE
jgi:Clostripain family